MGNIDLIALDLDGTLLDPSGRVTQASKDAIAQARAAGVEVFLATGRAAPEAAYFAQEAGCGVLAAALGGAVLCDSRTGAHIRRWDLPRESGRRALELCLGRGIDLMIFAGETHPPGSLFQTAADGVLPLPQLPRQRRSDGGPPWPIWRSTTCP